MGVVDAIGKSLEKVFGSRNQRLIKSYTKRVAVINSLEDEIRKLTDAQLREKTQSLRDRIANGEKAVDVQPEAFAVMREALDRHVGIRNIFNPAFKDQFDVSALPSDVQKQYVTVLEQMEATEPIRLPGSGSEDLIPGYMQVDIPNEIYNAVREIYLEPSTHLREGR